MTKKKATLSRLRELLYEVQQTVIDLPEGSKKVGFDCIHETFTRLLPHEMQVVFDTTHMDAVVDSMVEASDEDLSEKIKYLERVATDRWIMSAHEGAVCSAVARACLALSVRGNSRVFKLARKIKSTMKRNQQDKGVQMVLVAIAHADMDRGPW